MKRFALALAAIGLVGLLSATATAQTPLVASLSTQVAVASVGHHPYAHWRGHYAPRAWYGGPVVVAPRMVVPVAPPPVMVAPPAAVYSPYYVPRRSSMYYATPGVSVGVGF